MRAVALLLTALALLGCRSKDVDAPTPDLDGDGYDALTDCDDTHAEVFPGADERCNEVDDDCDDEVDEDPVDGDVFFRDADEDGYGDPYESTEACTLPDGYVVDDQDCSDHDPRFHPGATEDDCTDPSDYNCDGSVGFEDGDGDGWAACEDCDDADPLVSPAAYEVCDGEDNDCDGVADVGAIDAPTWYTDADRDGYGDPDAAVDDCEAPEGTVEDDTDCDDADGMVHPGAEEHCDGDDEDCDGEADEDAVDGATWYQDLDGDGYGSAVAVQACAAPPGYAAEAGDCDDLSALASPLGTEVCDGRDNDCDGDVDGGAADAPTWYADGDGDGYGDPAVATVACAAPADAVARAGDCDDTAASARPGGVEVCDGLDNDCDGVVDGGALDARVWYADVDGDTHGDPDASTEACTAPAGAVALGDDCDDTDGTAYPGAPEVCDGDDEDCDGVADDGAIDAPTWYLDYDGDGFGSSAYALDACAAPAGYAADGTDCDDLRADTHPGAPEVCDGVDQDCSGVVDDAPVDPLTWFADTDADGHGDPAVSVEACEAPAGHVAAGDDCDDTTATVSPEAPEVCNHDDDDCDGAVDEDAIDAPTWYLDYDGDGAGGDRFTAVACDAPAGHVATATDCDDLDASAHPGGTEVCDGADNDCDGTADEDATDAPTWYADGDGDGYGDPDEATVACSAPGVANALDCDDTSAAARPGGTEVCDGLDNDCDGAVDVDALDALTWYVDGDGDTWGTTPVEGCTQPAGTVARTGDCDDAVAAVNPGAPEVCDGADNDCDGTADVGATDAITWYHDTDGDGFGGALFTTQACVQPAGTTASATDCDDLDAESFPGGVEVCDRADNDCDGSADEGVVGDAAACPAVDCLDLHLERPGAPSGVYWVDGGGAHPAVELHCDMVTAGGGWTHLATTTWSSPWTASYVLDSTLTASATPLTANYRSAAWTDGVLFMDLMFVGGGDEYAVYEDVSDGSMTFMEYLGSVPLYNCATHSYAMTEGNLAGSRLCSTNLYVNTYDYDGSSGCRNDNNATGPAWSNNNNDGCALDDPSHYSLYLNAGAGYPWSTYLQVWAR